MHRQAKKKQSDRPDGRCFELKLARGLLEGSLMAGTGDSLAEVAKTGCGGGAGEDEIELELGLSIGGRFRKQEEGSKRARNLSMDLGPMGLQWKREIHAQRRQEARKKQQLKKGACSSSINGAGHASFAAARNDDNEKMRVMEEQQLQLQLRARIRDREATENEANERECAEFNDGNEKKRRANVNRGTGDQDRSSIPAQYFAPWASPDLQYVPSANGYAFPIAMPCWSPASANGIGETNIVSPTEAGNIGFRPFWPYNNNNNNNSNGGDADFPAISDVDRNGVKVAENNVLGSHRSPGHSCSVSDYQCSSQRGGSSSDTKSHTSSPHPPLTPRLIVAASKTPRESKHDDTSKPTEIEFSKRSDQATDDTEKQTAVCYQAISSAAPNSAHASGPLTEAEEERKWRANSSTLQVPSVVTTGNGPNGKTVTGFLYRYTKAEVTIVCVCHGISFSPVEFVKHAGGTDITHPLRNITVVPSAFR